MNRKESNEVYRLLLEEKKIIDEQIDALSNNFDMLPSFEKAIMNFEQMLQEEEGIFQNIKINNKKYLFDLKLKKINLNYIIYFLELIDHDLHNLNHFHIIYDLFHLRNNPRYDGLMQLIKIDLEKYKIDKLDFSLFILENYSNKLKREMTVKYRGKKVSDFWERTGSSYSIIDSIIGDEPSLNQIKIILNVMNIIIYQEFHNIMLLLDEGVINTKEMKKIHLICHALKNNSGKKPNSVSDMFNSLKDYMANITNVRIYE